jgi:putative peptidoglycan lipid II flippase
VSAAQDSTGRVVAAAGLLAASVLAARVLGFFRDALFAHYVGSGAAADAYFAAFLIPDIMGYLMAAGAAAVAVTPPYLKRLEREGAEAAAGFASVVVGNVGLISVALTALLWVAAEPLLRLQFRGFDEATLSETLHLLRIVLPAQIFFLTGGVLRGVLMAHGRFGPQALASVVYSAAPILGGVLFSMLGDGLVSADGFAWGTLAGAAIGQWAIPAVALRKLPGAVGRIRIGLLDGDFREYVWLALPLMLGLGLATVDEWYEKWIGATLAPGAIAAITYARKLMMAPVGVVGQAVGAALLPSLTALYQREDRTGFDALFTNALRTTLAFGLLAAGALAVLAGPAVRFLYEHGKFGEDQSVIVIGLLSVLAWAVPGWVVQQVAVRGFYARGEMWRAMALSSGIALAVFPLYWWGGREHGLEGLAYASTTAISLNAVVTVIWLRARAGSPDPLALAQTLVRGALVVSVTGIVTAVAMGYLAARTENALAQLILGGGLYGVVALGAVRLLGDEPMRAGLDRVASTMLGQMRQQLGRLRRRSK